MTERELMIALKERYPSPGWALLPQVRNSTGAGRVTRTADALAFGLWPSRGLDLHGIEVKVSRSDWQRELIDPAKADEIARFCDYWYLAVSDASIVRPGELPSTWGLLAPDAKGKLSVKVEAKKLDAQPLSRGFVGAVLRKTLDTYIPREDVQAEVEQAREEAKEHRSYIQKQNEKEIADLRSMVLEFENASGLTLRAYLHETNPSHTRRLGAAVKLAMGGEEAIRRFSLELGTLQKRATQIAEQIAHILSKQPEQE